MLRHEGLLINQTVPIHARWLFVAFFLSGAASLGYELVWTRLLSLALGSERLAVSGVLLGFFGGMALGSFLLDKPIRACTRPAVWFVGLECFAAVYAVAAPFLILKTNALLPLGVGLVGQVFFAGAILLPATFCLGATLAALTHVYRKTFPDEVKGRGVGWLYAANTLGATVGVMTSIYIFIPGLGMIAASFVFAGLGLASAGIVMNFWSMQKAPPIPAEVEPARDNPFTIYLLLALTGFLGMGVEVVGLQILSQVLWGTVYTFANALAIFLLGLSLGSWLYAKWIRERKEPLSLLLWLYAVSLLLAVMALKWVSTSASFERWAGHELFLPLLLFLVPSLCMGALFSHLAGRRSGSIGKAYAVNTLGAALAPLLLGSVAVGAWGYSKTFYLIIIGLGVMYLLSLWLTRPKLKWIGPGVGSLIVLFVAAPSSLVLLKVPEGWTSLKIKEGVMGTVMVTEKGPLRRLQVNRSFFMGGRHSFGERRLGHLPLLLAPNATNALFLGMGTGSTLSAAKPYPLKHIDSVEIMPEIVESLSLFNRVNGEVYKDPRVKIHQADARRFLVQGQTPYDLIVADLFHPHKDGAAFLYTEEHFRSARSRLSRQGVMVQWLPLYQMDLETLKIIARTFLHVFPDTRAFMGIYNARMPVLALVANASLPLELEPMKIWLKGLSRAQSVFESTRDFYGCYIMDAERLADFAGAGAMNRDLHPKLLFRPGLDREENPGPQNLKTLIGYRLNEPGKIFELTEALDRQAFSNYFEAATYFFAGDIEWAEEGGAKPSRSTLEWFFDAYKADASFSPVRGHLFNLALHQPTLADEIYSLMLKHRPEDPRIYQAYLVYLRATRQAAKFKQIKGQALEVMRQERLFMPVEPIPLGPQ